MEAVKKEGGYACLITVTEGFIDVGVPIDSLEVLLKKEDDIKVRSKAQLGYSLAT